MVTMSILLCALRYLGSYPGRNLGTYRACKPKQRTNATREGTYAYPDSYLPTPVRKGREAKQPRGGEGLWHSARKERSRGCHTRVHTFVPCLKPPPGTTSTTSTSTPVAVQYYL